MLTLPLRRTGSSGSTLALPIQAPLRRLVIVVQTGDDARIPTKQLLGPRRERLHYCIAECPDVVDLLLKIRPGKLLVDGEAVRSRDIDSCGVPERRIEH